MYDGCECDNCGAEIKAQHEAERWAEGAWLRAAENAGQTVAEEEAEAAAHGVYWEDFSGALADACGR